MSASIAVILSLVVPTHAQNVAPGSASFPAQGAAPQIEFASPVFNFGTVKQGEIIRHDFVFKNSGTATLEITAVNPGCGCTTAGDWDKRVEPGKTGIIPLQFNSAGFSAGVIKSATVSSNDPRQPMVNLQIKGEIWTPFVLSPTMAIFNASTETDASETKVIRIVSQSDEPVTLTNIEGSNPAFRTELTPVTPGKEYEVKITAAPPFPSSSLSVPFTVKTSSPENPAIPVLAQLIIQPAIATTPDRIMLPAGTLAGVTSTVITVRNNGKNVLALSEPTINVPGAKVTIKELQPGRLFNLAVQFPAGFDVLAGEFAEVSVKSNHPKFALIRIPVMSAPPPKSPGVALTK